MLDPDITEERREQIAAEARKRIESGGSLKQDTTWGTRKLAYEIEQRTEADYRFFRFETDGGLLDDLNHNLRIADGVLRFRIFKVDPRSPAIVPPARSGRRRRPRTGGRARSARERELRRRRLDARRRSDSSGAGPRGRRARGGAEAPATPPSRQRRSPAKPRRRRAEPAADAAERAPDTADAADAAGEASRAGRRGRFRARRLVANR